MDFKRLERRVAALELMSNRLRLIKGSGTPSGQRSNCDTVSLLEQLEDLVREVQIMKEDAQFAGDRRTALACMREFCRIIELIARLRGELDERNQTNIVQVNVDAETAIRIAETYLKRQKALQGEAE